MWVRAGRQSVLGGQPTIVLQDQTGHHDHWSYQEGNQRIRPEEESGLGGAAISKQLSPPEIQLPSTPACPRDNALRWCNPWPPIHGRRIRWRVNACSCSR